MCHKGMRPRSLRDINEMLLSPTAYSQETGWLTLREYNTWLAFWLTTWKLMFQLISWASLSPLFCSETHVVSSYNTTLSLVSNMKPFVVKSHRSYRKLLIIRIKMLCHHCNLILICFFNSYFRILTRCTVWKFSNIVFIYNFPKTNSASWSFLIYYIKKNVYHLKMKCLFFNHYKL